VAGAAAVQHGITFQHKVTAWLAVRILANELVAQPWGLPSLANLDFISAETGLPVDDLLVGTSRGGLVFGQVKRTASLSAGSAAGLSSAVDQFVRQFAYSRGTGRRGRWHRRLSIDTDRFVLFIGPESSRPIRSVLPRVLARTRTLLPGQSLSDAALNAQERQALQHFRQLLAGSWKRQFGQAPRQEDEQELMAFIRIHMLDVEVGGSAELQARDLLGSVILRDPKAADLAWGFLCSACAGLAATRSSADRVALQRILLDAGLDLRPPRADGRELGWPEQISISRLPPTGQLVAGEVFGREYELAFLDRQRSDPGANVVCITGWAGAGKTALLNKWLTRMAANQFQDATQVFAWSFFSQGSTEELASADLFLASALNWFGDKSPSQDSSWDKAERLLRVLRQKRCLLVLDGLEPLQYPPGAKEGELRDGAMQALLRELAAYNAGLCIVTSRANLNDLSDFYGRGLQPVPIDRLEEPAGIRLLRATGVVGRQNLTRAQIGDAEVCA
jgi:hypothetical protein